MLQRIKLVQIDQEASPFHCKLLARHTEVSKTLAKAQAMNAMEVLHLLHFMLETFVDLFWSYIPTLVKTISMRKLNDKLSFVLAVK